MFTIPEEIDYENKQNQLSIRSLINQCQNETRTNTFKFLWLDNLIIDDIINGKEDLHIRITPFSHNDLYVSQGLNYSTINASRFYCQYQFIKGQKNFFFKYNCCCCFLGDREDILLMNKLYSYSSQSSIPNVFPYSLVFPIYESLEQIRIEIYFLIVLLIILCFIGTLILFISLKQTFLIVLHFLCLLTSTLTCLYLFNNLTFNFVNILWLYVMPIIYLDIFIHILYKKSNDKWKYNRIIISLIISLNILYLFPIQSYIFQIIRNSLIYQSIICLILINLILPSWFYLFKKINKNDQIIKPIISSIEGNQSLTNGLEINSTI